MAEEYKPSRKEVFEEIENTVRTGGKKTLNSLMENGKDFFKMQKLIYALPSLMKDASKQKKITRGYVAGGLAVYIQSGFYLAKFLDDINNNFYFDHPWWIIPVCTNVASGLYESGKAIYKNTEKKLIEEHNDWIEKEVKE
jgi:hypothetical protein